jgi:hypothetical protein
LLLLAGIPAAIPPSASFPAPAIVAIANPPAIGFRPSDSIMAAARAGIAVAVVAPITPTTAIVAIPIVPLPAPITAMMIAHAIAATMAVKNRGAVAGIPIAVIPATAIADIVKAIAIVTIIITIERTIGIAIITGIAIVIIAQPHVIIATR